MKRLPFILSTAFAVVIILSILSGCPGLFVDPFLSASPHTGPAPMTVEFKMYKVDDFEGFEWIPGDGTGLINNNSDTLTHTYENPGTYYACCFVYDYQNPDMDNAAYVKITVTEPGFSASISTASEEICFESGEIPVSFSRVVTGGVAPYTFDWDFGDGSSSSSEDNPIIHNYNPLEPGMSYIVQLTVIDDTNAVVTSNQLNISFIDCPSGP